MTKTREALLLAAGPISSAVVYLVYAVRNAAYGVAWHAEEMPKPWPIDRPLLETLALVLLPIALALLLARLARHAERLLVLFAVGVTLLLLREIHFEEIALLKKATELGAYLGLPTVLVLGLVWRDRITATATWAKVRPWLIAALVTYVYSVVVSRRAFRFLPAEQAVHIPLEELAETTAHLLTVTAAAMTWCAACRRPEAAEPAPTVAPQDS